MGIDSPRSPDPRLEALSILYSTERSAGQDLQKLDFTIFSILLAFITACVGWVNEKQAITPEQYVFMEIPVAALGAYLIQIMAVSKSRSMSIDTLEHELLNLAGIPNNNQLHFGSHAEKRLTDIGTPSKDFSSPFLMGLVPIMYLTAIVGVLVWIGFCAYKAILVWKGSLFGIATGIITVSILLYLLLCTCIVVGAYLGKGNLGKNPPSIREMWRSFGSGITQPESS